jgi:DNA-binding transcriptional LysR family regulator
MSAQARVLLNRLLARTRFRHLQVLVRLAEIGSIKRAAEAIGLTQPAVTQLLADLEGLLEVQLFHRHARGVLPTAACLELLPLAQQSLAGLSATAEAIAERSSLGKGMVRIWASTAGINGLLTRAVPAFNLQQPEVQLHVQETEAQDLFLGIQRQQVDLGLCRQTEVLPEGWRFEGLMEDEFVAVCAAHHPLATRKRLRWRDLSEATWVISPVSSAARHQLDALSARLDQPLRQSQVITRVSSMTWAMLQQQALLTLAPASVFRQLQLAGELVALPMPEPLPMPPLGMVLAQRDVPLATQCLADFLKAFCKAEQASKSPRSSPKA